MACYNIVDHRHHCSDSKCDAVFEPVAHSKKTKVAIDLCDIQFLRKTTVAKAIVRAQTLAQDVTVWLYDSGSISKDEVRECKKSSS
jgi:hypothetical protein